jgi:hypothetical protein
MLNRNGHPNDEELLLFADGELTRRRTTQMRAHLSGCWSCRARMVEIEGSIVEFVRAHHQTIDPVLPPVDGPRALLRVQLSQLNAQAQVRPGGWIGQVLSARFMPFVICAAALTLLVSGSIVLCRIAQQPPNSIASGIERGSVPNPVLTPGVSRAVQMSDVCSMPHEEVIADVSPLLKLQVLKEYGVKDARPRDYEIDYLIAPGLGGTEDIHNLWPEPYNARPWNARVKDSLEEHLHQLVCAGKLDLPTAQHDIARDWIAAYKKYFHTERPLEVSEL